MKTATIKEIKIELSSRSPNELLEICLRLSKFKKENKELLTYLLYESNDEESYIQGVKFEIDQHFKQINTRNWYIINKSLRKILRTTKTHIRYSQNKQTEVELLTHFCMRLRNMKPSITDHHVLTNLLERQVELIRKSMLGLHEDLRYDYDRILDELI